MLIHSMVVDETGGLHGIRDRNAVLSLENLPRQEVFGKELYPTIFEKAAVYARSIIFNHPFADGNKRTGMTSAVIFLEDNNYEFIAGDGEIEKFALKIISDRLDFADIADWLRRHSKKK